MTRVIFVRHGQSASNADPRSASLPAEVGDRLTDLGREQARAVAEHLPAQGGTHLLHSTMRRARETAEIINEKLGLPMREVGYIQELRESDDYQDLSPEDQMLHRWSVRMVENADDPGAAPGGAESFNDVLGRVKRFKAELAELGAEGQTPVVVSHGLFMRFFLAHCIFGEEFAPRHAPRLWQLRSLNCSISVFAHDERWHPADPEIPDWSCITWMARPWDPPPLAPAP